MKSYNNHKHKQGTATLEKRQKPRERYRYDPRIKSRKHSKDRKKKPRKYHGPYRPQAGLLAFHGEGYGFVHADTKTLKFRPEMDCFVPQQVIRQYRLREGSYIEGLVSIEQKKDLYILSKVMKVDGFDPIAASSRPRFNKLRALSPENQIILEDPEEQQRNGNDLSLRMIDLFTPLGKGQRGIIISPPRSGKTMLLQSIAKSVLKNHPSIHVMVVLIDERPEEVTDWRRSTNAEVITSCSDQSPSNHVHVSRIAQERAKRLVESGKDVLVLLDSITRLGRAHNLCVKETGRTLSGGLDASVLEKPKEFIGAAREIENGGSLTILATCLVDTGSRMDQVIYEEFKGTGNMECVLCRDLANLRIFPAINIKISGTRKEERLIPQAKLKQICTLRRVMQRLDLKRGVQILLEKLGETKTNNQFLASFSANSLGSTQR